VNPQTHYRWRIAGFYFFYFAFVGTYSPYWGLYLKSIHLTAIEIGVLMSVQPVMRMLAPALWGWLAEHSGNRLRVIQAAAAISVLCYLGVFFTDKFWGMFAVLAAMGFFWSASMPLVEATTLTYLGTNTSHYGRIRSWGSVGFIVAVLALGYLFDYVAIRWLLWAGLTVMLGIMAFSRLLPATRAEPHHADHASLASIVLRPEVLAMFGACFLMAVAHGPYYTFFSIFLVEHGYTKSAVGLLWALGVVCEIGIFFLMPWLARRVSLPKILAIGLAAAVLRFSLIGWGVGVLALVLVAQALHAITFGAFHAAAVALVHHLFPGRHQSRGQALYGSLTYGAGGMLGNLLSGPLWKHWGPAVMYSMSAGVALLGLFILLWKLRAIEARVAAPA
jgi:MFS transporter, PPP family, 3-phenylpropionic acid transporter